MGISIGGLISGLDTDALIELAVNSQKVAVANIQKRQASYITRVSAFGEIASKLADVSKAAANLATNGARQVKGTVTGSTFSISTTSDAAPGNYSIAVERLATAAKVRSGAFASGDAAVRAGTLSISVKGGEAIEVEIEEGDTLSRVAERINAAGAGVTAAVITDGTFSYLSITNRSTGHAIGSSADSALVITQTFTGTEGTSLFGEPDPDLGTVEVRGSAANAVVWVDGLRVESTTNTVEGAVPGTTLTLRSVSSRDGNGDLNADTLVLEENRTGTKEKLQAFLDVYNSMIRLLKQKTNPGEGLTGDLSGESLARSLASDLQNLLTFSTGNGTISTLADLGVELQKDGTLLLNDSTFEKAFAESSWAVDAIFDGGLAEEFQNLTELYTNSEDGYLVQRQQGLQKVIDRLAEDAEVIEQRMTAMRENLAQKLAILESQMASYKTMQTFLDAQQLAMEVQAKR